MTQCSRKPAALVLLAALLLGTGYLWRARAADPAATALAELEREIARPGATEETWLRYAQCLQQTRQFDHAVMAYTHVLETDPCSQVANLQCAVALARLGDVDRLLEFVDRLVRLDPRLAVDVFGRPELQPHLAEAGFQRVYQHALAQSMD